MIRSKQTTTENLEADIEALQLNNCCIIQVIDCPISVTMVGTERGIFQHMIVIIYAEAPYYRDNSDT